MGLVRSLSLISGPGEVIVLYWAMLPCFCSNCILGRAPRTKETLSDFFLNHGSRKRGHNGVVVGYPMMNLKVIHFQSIFLIDFYLKKTDLCAEMWNN